MSGPEPPRPRGFAGRLLRRCRATKRGCGAQTSTHPPGLWRLPLGPQTPSLRDPWTPCWGATGTDGAERRHRAPPPSAPPGEAAGPSSRRGGGASAEKVPALHLPSCRRPSAPQVAATACRQLVPEGEGAGRASCGCRSHSARALCQGDYGMTPRCILTPTPGSPDSGHALLTSQPSPPSSSPLRCVGRRR